MGGTPAGLGVAAVSALIGIPLGALRGLFQVRWRGSGTCCSWCRSCCRPTSPRCRGPWRCNRAATWSN
ncbi:hypothetical protein WJ972_09225 [Achromobacter insuavis]